MRKHAKANKEKRIDKGQGSILEAQEESTSYAVTAERSRKKRIQIYLTKVATA